MRTLLRPIWFLLALVFLVEAWLWDHLAPPIARLVALLPFKPLRDAIAAGIARLPPWLTVFVFAIPGLVLLPFKLAGLWLIATGHPLLGLLTFLMAKTVGLAITAFLYETCRPKLMELAWFRSLSAWMVQARDWALRQTAPARRRIHAIKRLILRKVAPLRRRGLASRLRARVHRHYEAR